MTKTLISYLFAMLVFWGLSKIAFALFSVASALLAIAGELKVANSKIYQPSDQQSIVDSGAEITAHSTKIFKDMIAAHNAIQHHALLFLIAIMVALFFWFILGLKS